MDSVQEPDKIPTREVPNNFSTITIEVYHTWFVLQLLVLVLLITVN